MFVNRLKRNRIAGISLLILFALYWCGITLFTHSHVVNGVVVVHSHPYNTEHTHTQAQFETIFYFLCYKLQETLNLVLICLYGLFLYIPLFLLVPVYFLYVRQRMSVPESVEYNPIRWTCFYVEIKSTYFTSSKMRYSASVCGMDKKKNR